MTRNLPSNNTFFGLTVSSLQSDFAAVYELRVTYHSVDGIHSFVSMHVSCPEKASNRHHCLSYVKRTLSAEHLKLQGDKRAN